MTNSTRLPLTIKISEVIG